MVAVFPNAQFLRKKSQGIQRNKETWPIQNIKINLNKKHSCEETQLSDLLDKDFKTTILKMLKKLKKKYGKKSKGNQKKQYMHKM